MNSEFKNNLYNNGENITFSSDKTRYIKYEDLVPSIQYESRRQENSKNLKYFPILTKDTFTGQHTIYLAAEDNDNQNNNIIKNENKSTDKTNNSEINNKNIIVPQRSIEFQLKNENFEYLLNLPVKKENEIYKNIDNNKINNSNQNNIKKINSFKEDEKEEEKKNNNYKNIKEDFISTTKNLYDSNINKDSKLIHSYSVENYIDIPYKSLPNIPLNLAILNNSKIMNENFIRGIRDSKRKENLLKAIEKYKRYKSLGKKNNNDNNDALNNSFTFGIEQKNRQKSIERIKN